MNAAESLFATKQFHEITLDAVARKAGIGKGTIYLYFADKNDLFFQTAVSGYDELCAALRACAAGDIPFHESLLRACRQISDFFRDRRPLFRMIMMQYERALGRGGSLRERWIERRAKLPELIAVIIRRGVKAGEVRADMPAHVMAEYLLAMLRARVTELEKEPEQLRTHANMVDLFTNGARQRAAGKRKMAQ